MKIYFAKNDPCHEWLHLVESYQKNVNKEMTVLEVGASTKSRTEQLCPDCKTLLGLELMPERKPEDFANVEYIIGDWQELSSVTGENSIDMMVSNHVIEHVVDDAKAIAELYKALKHGGLALFNTPNRKRLPRTIIEFFSKAKKFPFWEHQREYIEQDLIDLLEASPFKNYEITPVVFGNTGWKLHFYTVKVPKCFRGLCASWEVKLVKD